MRDSDLASLYGVETKVLNQASAGTSNDFLRTSCSGSRQKKLRL